MKTPPPATEPTIAGRVSVEALVSSDAAEDAIRMNRCVRYRRSRAHPAPARGPLGMACRWRSSPGPRTATSAPIEPKLPPQAIVPSQTITEPRIAAQGPYEPI
jgi:hypothetical protein